MIQQPAAMRCGIATGRQVPRGAGVTPRRNRRHGATQRGWRQGAAGSARLVAMALNRSIGSGKTIVELLSPAMLASVCK